MTLMTDHDHICRLLNDEHKLTLETAVVWSEHVIGHVRESTVLLVLTYLQD